MAAESVGFGLPDELTGTQRPTAGAPRQPTCSASAPSIENPVKHDLLQFPQDAGHGIGTDERGQDQGAVRLFGRLADLACWQSFTRSRTSTPLGAHRPATAEPTPYQVR